MNGIITSGENKRPSSIRGGFAGTPAPTGHGLGAERADPLSPLNHPSG
jgi:hypothetical protein